jgi:hypothetical protein
MNLWMKPFFVCESLTFSLVGLIKASEASEAKL